MLSAPTSSPTVVSLERRPLGDGGHVLVSADMESDGVLAAFTERRGGASAAPFDSLNLSLAVGDAGQAVRENRARVLHALGIPPFATAEQVHGARLGRIGPSNAGAGWEDAASRVPSADALATSTPGVPLGVMAADCVPVLLHARGEGTLAAVHAGWRGIAAGIIGTVVSTFRDRREVRAAIGPAVGPCHYEVEPEVVRAVEEGTSVGSVTVRRGGSVALDLAGTIRAELRALGLGAVEDADLCTACHPDRFFSYRRDGLTGRQAAVAAILA